MFGNMFDFDRNGTFDSLERALDFNFLSNLLDDKKQQLVDVGLDIDELSQMDKTARRSAIITAGLDPDDYEI